MRSRKRRSHLKRRLARRILSMVHALDKDEKPQWTGLYSRRVLQYSTAMEKRHTVKSRDRFQVVARNAVTLLITDSLEGHNANHSDDVSGHCQSFWI